MVTRGGTFVQRLALMRRCVGESRASRTPVDLSGVLCDAHALQELVAELLLPFAQLQIDQVVALHVQHCEVISAALKRTAHAAVASVRKSSRSKRGSREAEKEQSADESSGAASATAGEPVAETPEREVHHFTTAIAGAIAGARQLGTTTTHMYCAYSSVWEHR